MLDPNFGSYHFCPLLRLGAACDLLNNDNNNNNNSKKQEAGSKKQEARQNKECVKVNAVLSRTSQDP